MANMISSFFDPGEAYDRARQAENEGYGHAQGYLDPYNQHGQDQYGRLNQGANDLMNPDFYNKLASGYQNSPYAQQMLSQNMSSGQDAASAMGLGGSSAAVGNIQQGAGRIVQQDRQQYLDNIMKNYMNGIGIGKDLYGTGAQAAGQQSSNAMTHGQEQGGLQYGRYSAPGQLFGQGLGVLSNLPGINQLFGSENRFNSGGGQ